MQGHSFVPPLSKVLREVERQDGKANYLWKKSDSKSFLVFEEHTMMLVCHMDMKLSSF